VCKFSKLNCSESGYGHRDGSLCAPATLLARADEVIE